MGATPLTFSPLKDKRKENVVVLKRASHSNTFGDKRATYVIAHVQNQDISASESSCLCHSPFLSSPHPVAANATPTALLDLLFFVSYPLRIEPP